MLGGLSMINQLKKKGFFICIIVMLVSTNISFNASSISNDSSTITDPVGDVMVFDQNFYSGEVEQEYTSEVPSADIIEASYQKVDDNIQVMFKVNEDGLVETIDLYNMNESDLLDFLLNSTEPIPLAYGITVITDQSEYRVSYEGGNCSLNYEQQLNFTVNQNIFLTEFSINSAEEKIKKVGVQSFFMDFSLTSSTIYMDVAPDSFMWMAEIRAPSSGLTGEQVEFRSEVYSLADLFGMGTFHENFSYTWNFGDGTSGFGKTTTHMYTHPGNYTVSLDVFNETSLVTSATHQIHIGKRDTTPPTVRISKPEKGLYIGNKKIVSLPFQKPIIIGPISIEVTAFDSESTIDRVEFFVNENFKHIDETYPYSFSWVLDSKSLFNHQYTLRVDCYDTFENYAYDKVDVWRFFGSRPLPLYDVVVPDDYPTIQQAIDASKENDEIFVKNGYYEGLVVIDKPIDLVGEDQENTIIDGGGNEDVIRIIGEGRCELSSFTVKNSGVNHNGVEIRSSNNSFSNLTITDCYTGIYCYNGDSNFFDNNVFSEHTNYCLYLYSSKDTTIKRNLFENNSCGIRVKGSRDTKIIENSFKDNYQGMYFCCGASNNVAYYNTFLNNAAWNANDYCKGNTWYNQETLKGNYWDDYTGIDEDNDGIGDFPYNITSDGAKKDLYPLMKPYYNIELVSLQNQNDGLRSIPSFFDVESIKEEFIVNNAVEENSEQKENVNMVNPILFSTETVSFFDKLKDVLCVHWKKIQSGDCADVHYILRYDSNNTLIDSSYADPLNKTGGDPLKVFVDETKQKDSPKGYSSYTSNYIDGLLSRLIGKDEGETYFLEIPPSEAYGEKKLRVGDRFYCSSFALNTINPELSLNQTLEVTKLTNTNLSLKWVGLDNYGPFTMPQIVLRDLRAQNQKDMILILPPYFIWENASKIIDFNEQITTIITTPTKTENLFDSLTQIQFGFGQKDIFIIFPDATTASYDETTITLESNPEIGSEYEYVYSYFGQEIVMIYTVKNTTEDTIGLEIETQGQVQNQTVQRSLSFDRTYEFPRTYKNIPSDYQEALIGEDLAREGYSLHPLAGEKLLFEVDIVNVYKTSFWFYSFFNSLK